MFVFNSVACWIRHQLRSKPVFGSLVYNDLVVINTIIFSSCEQNYCYVSLYTLYGIRFTTTNITPNIMEDEGRFNLPSANSAHNNNSNCLFSVFEWLLTELRL